MHPLVYLSLNRNGVSGLTSKQKWLSFALHVKLETPHSSRFGYLISITRALEIRGEIQNRNRITTREDTVSHLYVEFLPVTRNQLCDGGIFEFRLP